jgi:hypothetical protein
MASNATGFMTWEDTFQSWGKPPSNSEQEKCDNAVRGVRKAIEGSRALEGRTISVFAQGSYRNRTNVGAVSDVDVCVLCNDSIFFDLPAGQAPADFGITTPAAYPYDQFKNEVGAALTSYFGQRGVTRGKKAFNLHANTYRVDADVVPCFEHKWYHANGNSSAGTAFLTDQGKRIVNWPEQSYNNGVTKNDATSRRFKALVRILKQLRNSMDEDGIAAAKPIPSFLIECLAWNVPDDHFGHNTYTRDVRAALAYLFNNTMKREDCGEWGEINELKYVFSSGQPWTWGQAHAFVSAAWGYVGFE